MAMVMTSTRNAGRMVQKRSGRVAAKAALLLAAAGVLALCRASSLAFATTLGRPMVQDRPSANNKNEGDADQNKKSKKAKDIKGQSNATLALENDRLTVNGYEAAASPKWAMCFVEHEEAGSSVLEEFVLRADRDNMEAFHAWQHSAGVEKKTRCVEDSAPAEDTMCIECLAHASSMSHNIPDGRAAVASVSTQLIDTFTGLEKCMRATFDGNSFCKSGRVVVPA